MIAPSVEPVNILLVDDRPNNLSSLKALLERSDYRLVLARSGAEALGHLLREEFALILMDVAMPGMDGFETARLMKEREQSKLIPIIFVTGAAYEMEHIFRGYTVGAVDYLQKPMDPHAVRAKVAVFVELYRQRKQLEAQERQLHAAEVREEQLRRRVAEEALEVSEELYRQTFQEAPVGIGHGSAAGRWTRANRRLCETLGLSQETLTEQPIEAMGEANERPALADALESLRRGAQLYRAEHRLSAPGDGGLWAEVTFSALRGKDGTLREILVVVEDIDERKQNELDRAALVRNLEEGIRSRDEFLSLAAHELRTPLTPLRLQAAGLMREASAIPDEIPPSVVRRLATIDRAAGRLETLIDRLLDASALTAGPIALTLEGVELGELVRDALENLRGYAERAHCVIVLEPGPPIVGRWDRLRLDQAITNVLANAIKYGRGKPIEVSIEHAGQTARVKVRDHGVGISKEGQAQIFDRFGRVAPIANFGGFGLGLWMVRQIVQGHGGEVTVWSRPLEGSQFTIELPLQPRAALEAEAPQ